MNGRIVLVKFFLRGARSIYLDFIASGGAERLIVDAAVEFASRGHDVHIFTAHHDKNRCFDETKDGNLSNILCGCYLCYGFLF